MPNNHFQPVNLMFGENLWQKIRKPLISIFVLLHFGVIFSYMLPANAVMSSFQRPFNKYFWFMGLYQTYAVFAPPKEHNVHLIALVTYKDGSTRIYPLPRLDRVPLFDKLRKERFRKFLDDNSAWPESTVFRGFLISGISRYAARECNVFKDNPPHTVSLIRLSSRVPLLRNSTLTIMQGPDPLAQASKNVPHTTLRLLRQYRVTEDDLK